MSDMPNLPLLVATDLDGTIVPPGGAVSPRTVAAFALAEKAGARFVLVTGRPPRVMPEIAAAFGNTGTAICANGALAYDMATGQAEPLNLIPPADLVAAARALRKAVPGIGLAVEHADGHAADPLYRAAVPALDRAIPRVPDSELFARPAAKLLGRHYDYTPDQLLALAGPACEGIVTVSHSNATSLIEASALGVSKASAVAALAARHGIGPDRVLAFGDMPNDLPLLSWAGHSCAVANAHPEVLAAATRVIGGCAEDGVAVVLEELYAAQANT